MDIFIMAVKQITFNEKDLNMDKLFEAFWLLLLSPIIFLIGLCLQTLNMAVVFKQSILIGKDLK